MEFKSNPFYMEVKGDYALFTAPETKGGGEKYSYTVPTKQALEGIVDGIYWKPVLKNVVDEVRVINPIKTEVKGIRTLLTSGGQDINYYSYLRDVRYFVKYHFEWNLEREDLKQDRNEKKHQEIMLRSLRKGGRMDIFLGTRECVGYVKKLTKEEYEAEKTEYLNENMNLGIMFHSFKYPQKNKKLKSYYTNTIMTNGRIIFKKQEECEIENILSEYKFKYPEKQKSVDEEFLEYEKFEKEVNK